MSYQVELEDKQLNKEGVVNAVMQIKSVSEEVAIALIWDSLATFNGIEFLTNDMEG